VKIIYHVEQNGVVGVIESPDVVDPVKPLAKQLIVKIGFSADAPWLDTADFEPRARLVVLELLNHIHNEIGIEQHVVAKFLRPN
jgi:hypothetical protein